MAEPYKIYQQLKSGMAGKGLVTAEDVEVTKEDGTVVNVKDYIDSNSGASSAEDVSFDDSSAGLGKTNVQDAVDYLSDIRIETEDLDPSAPITSDKTTLDWLREQDAKIDKKIEAEDLDPSAPVTSDKSTLDWLREQDDKIDAKVGEAPKDGKKYSRKDGTWVESDAGGIQDAPSDGSQYARKNGLWDKVIIPSPGIGDANSDGKSYVRKNGAWSELPAYSASNASFTNSGTGISATTVQGALEEINTSKQDVMKSATPEFDQESNCYAFAIEEDTKATRIDWSDEDDELYIFVSNCPNEVLVYFNGSARIFDDATKRLGEEVEIEDGKNYVASYLDGVVAICEIQDVE